MTTAEVANNLVSLCRQGNFEEAVSSLYSQDIVSIEPAHTPEPYHVEGLEVVKQKGAHFAASFQVHGVEISDALISGNHFSVRMAMDVTQQDNQQRYTMDEVCVYEVKDGKIVREQFFY